MIFSRNLSCIISHHDLFSRLSNSNRNAAVQVASGVLLKKSDGSTDICNQQWAIIIRVQAYYHTIKSVHLWRTICNYIVDALYLHDRILTRRCLNSGKYRLTARFLLEILITTGFHCEPIYLVRAQQDSFSFYGLGGRDERYIVRVKIRARCTWTFSISFSLRASRLILKLNVRRSHAHRRFSFVLIFSRRLSTGTSSKYP